MLVLRGTSLLPSQAQPGAGPYAVEAVLVIKCDPVDVEERAESRASP